VRAQCLVQVARLPCGWRGRHAPTNKTQVIETLSKRLKHAVRVARLEGTHADQLADPTVDTSDSAVRLCECGPKRALHEGVHASSVYRGQSTPRSLYEQRLECAGSTRAGGTRGLSAPLEVAAASALAYNRSACLQLPLRSALRLPHPAACAWLASSAAGPFSFQRAQRSGEVPPPRCGDTGIDRLTHEIVWKARGLVLKQEPTRQESSTSDTGAACLRASRRAVLTEGRSKTMPLPGDAGASVAAWQRLRMDSSKRSPALARRRSVKKRDGNRGCPQFHRVARMGAGSSTSARERLQSDQTQSASRTPASAS